MRFLKVSLITTSTFAYHTTKACSAVPSMPVKQLNFCWAKRNHYIELTNKLKKPLFPPHSLDVDAVYQDFYNLIRKATKKTIPSGHRNNYAIFRVRMPSVKPFTKPSCSLLMETNQVWLLQLYLPSLTKSGKINGPKQFGASDFHTLVAKHGVY